MAESLSGQTGAGFTVSKDFVMLLKHAQAEVEASPLFKRFIDGTPLANDIAVWMADFAMAHGRTKTSPPLPAQVISAEQIAERAQNILKHLCVDWLAADREYVEGELQLLVAHLTQALSHAEQERDALQHRAGEMCAQLPDGEIRERFRRYVETSEWPQEMARHADDLACMSAEDNHNAQEAAKQIRRWADQLSSRLGDAT